MEDISLQGIAVEPRITMDNLKMALMSPSGMSKVWVLLEGEADLKVFGAFFSEQTVSVKQAMSDTGHGGYKIVEDIVSAVSREFPAAAILGIRDRDYTPYHNPSYSMPENVFATDRRDLEMMLAERPSVRVQLALKLPGFETVENKIMPILRHMGYSRAYASCNHRRCQFDDIFKASRIWSDVTHDFHDNWKSYCSTSFQTHLGVPPDALDSFIAEHHLHEESKYDICRGHDYVAYLSKAMVKTATYSEGFIYEVLYTTYSRTDFTQSKLYASIKAWQQARGVVVV